MIDLLPDMPADTIGLRVSGAITRDDFREIEPVIREAAERGDLRVVEVIGPEYEGIRAGAVVEDLKFGVEFFVRHRSALKRIAVVTDTDWIARAVPALTWLIPGEARVFDLAELEQAKAWAAREEGSQSGGPLASESPSEVRATANMTASRAAQRRSVVVAYDGSEPSKVAVRRTAELFPDRRAVVATVWEPDLAVMAWGAPPGTLGGFPLDPETTEKHERTEQEHASRVANEGVELARSLGLEAEPHVVPDALDIADTLIDLARERGAAALAVGTHGMARLRSALLGSVAQKLISHGDIPVVVVRDKSA